MLALRGRAAPTGTVVKTNQTNRHAQASHVVGAKTSLQINFRDLSSNLFLYLNSFSWDPSSQATQQSWSSHACEGRQSERGWGTNSRLLECRALGIMILVAELCMRQKYSACGSRKILRVCACSCCCRPCPKHCDPC